MATVTIPVKYIDTTKYVATIEAVSDEWDDPRDWDNLGTMACYHRRYELGDVRLNPDDNRTWVEIEKHLKNEEGARIVLPLGLYDHSGITMSVGVQNGWDSGQVGFIYVTADELRAEYGVKRITKNVLARAESVLRAEVDTYDMYLRGDVYRVSIETEHGKDVESCGGIYGTEGVKEYIKDIIGDAECREEWA
jgi:hypothetical protein